LALVYPWRRSSIPRDPKVTITGGTVEES